MNALELAGALRESRGFAHKSDIGDVMAALARHQPAGAVAQAVAVGDDCAAIPFNDADGEGYLLFAIEGLVEDFIARMPWFAGYCSVMVNVSDIYAMGGRPLAVVDALWSQGMDPAAQVLEGMSAASARYGVPIVGGHSNNRALHGQLAVAILGRARRLLTSFNARPGDQLVMAVDLRGAYEEPYPYWNASTSAPASRLRADLELLPQLAEAGLCDAAKDISMAGVVGTALMLLECSKVGAHIDIDAVPRPAEVQGATALLRWLTAFPSYGFILSVRPGNTAQVLDRFRARDLACAVVGEVTESPELWLAHQGAQALLWNTAEQAFITAREPSHA
ncbi:MAG: hypothetical protein JWP29_4345 [Rhodoferax sp.]|nr:hypothetical protein [Rhodoferax sp.]